MNAKEMVAACQDKEHVDLIVNRRWAHQHMIKLFPGGKAKGIPIERKKGGKTVVRFRAADVIRELEPFAKLEDFVNAHPEMNASASANLGEQL